MFVGFSRKTRERSLVLPFLKINARTHAHSLDSRLSTLEAFFQLKTSFFIFSPNSESKFFTWASTSNPIKFLGFLLLAFYGLLVPKFFDLRLVLVLNSSPWLCSELVWAKGFGNWGCKELRRIKQQQLFGNLFWLGFWVLNFFFSIPTVFCLFWEVAWCLRLGFFFCSVLLL